MTEWEPGEDFKRSHPDWETHDSDDAQYWGGRGKSGGYKPNGSTPLDEGGLAVALAAETWAALDIPPEQRLLGDLVTPGSRTFLVGMTGLGKTLFGYALVAAMASGKGLLHWRCDRPSRWLIIDGEMPTSLIKKRIGDVLSRGGPIPQGNI